LNALSAGRLLAVFMAEAELAAVLDDMFSCIPPIINTKPITAITKMTGSMMTEGPDLVSLAIGLFLPSKAVLMAFYTA